MLENTRDPLGSPWLTIPSTPRSMKADLRPPSTMDRSSSVCTQLGCGRDSSSVSGWSSTSCPRSVVAVSKSGSSSSGGISTTVFRLGGGGGATLGEGVTLGGGATLGGAADGRLGTTGWTRGALGRLGTNGCTFGFAAGAVRGGATRGGGARCSSGSNPSPLNGPVSTSASAGTVGSSSAIGSRSATGSGSRIDGVSTEPPRMMSKSAPVVWRPSSMPPATGSGAAPSAILVVSISSDVSGSGVTCSRREARWGTAGARAGGAAGARSGLVARGEGSSKSKKTRLEVLCLVPVFASGCGGGAAAVLARGMPADERRCSSPYIFRCSASISRRCSLSGEMSVNSFSAAKACWIFPARCIRSAYSTKFCLASAMNPLAA